MDGIDTAYRIVADHLRMITVCLADGMRPGNKDLECVQVQFLFILLTIQSYKDRFCRKIYRSSYEIR